MPNDSSIGLPCRCLVRRHPLSGNPRKVICGNRTFFLLLVVDGRVPPGDPIRNRLERGIRQERRPIARRIPQRAPSTLIYPVNQGATNWFIHLTARHGSLLRDVWENTHHLCAHYPAIHRSRGIHAGRLNATTGPLNRCGMRLLRSVRSQMERRPTDLRAFDPRPANGNGTRSI